MAPRYPGRKPTVGLPGQLNLWSVLMDMLNNLLGGILTGNGAGLATPFAFLADLVGLRWLQADETEQSVGDLQDRTQQLEGVIGHGSAYMPTSPGATTSAERMPFGTTEASRVGPQVGVEWLGDGRVRLLSRGLWDVSAQVEFWGGLLMPPGTFMDVVVRNPSGGLFYRMKAKASTSDNVTVTNVTSVTVPDAGYTVEVQAWTSSIPLGGTFRGISGGLETTRLMVRKISQETS